MHHKVTSPLFLTLLLIVFLFPLVTIFAQDGSVESQSKVPPATVEETTTTPAPADAVIMAPREPDPGVFMEVTSTPQEVVPRPTPTPTPGASTNPTPVATSTGVQDIDITESADTNYVLWLALAALAILPLGYVAVKVIKNQKTKEKKENSSRCFDLKQLLDKALKELTDLKGQLQGEAKNKVREVISEGVRGTATGELLALVEKAEKEYSRLKKLYEECIVEFEGFSLKGIIIENSLKDRNILDEVRIEKTEHRGNDIFHDVYVHKDQISKLSEQLSDKPGYIRFWEPGKDDVQVIFKNKTFTVTSSDKSTWVDAISYAKSIGMNDSQIDFSIN